jgi:N-acyl-D-amino-acid deacylase
MSPSYHICFRIFPLICVFLSGCAGSVSTARPAFDLVIRNGLILDGSGRAGFLADVGIRDGKFSVIGQIPRGGSAEIDASGLVVAPGFIDVHTHVDSDILRQPTAENFVRDGVTTIVTGNCGYGVGDVAAYFERMQKKGSAVNVATLIGHNTILQAVKGDKAGELAPAQMEQAKEMVRRAMLDGAMGMSTGLVYSPGQFSSLREIIELQKVAAECGGIYATHMRSEGAEILQAIDEALAVGRAAKCRVEISHFKLPADAARAVGSSDVTLGKVLDARRAGVEVWLDQYPYTASSTTISVLLPDEVLADGADAERARLAEPSEVERVVKLMRQLHEVKSHRTQMGYVVISSCSAYPGYAGRNILDIARTAKFRRAHPDAELLDLPADRWPVATMEDQYRVIIDIFVHGGASCVFHTMNESEVERIMRCPLVSIASDSGIREFGAGVPHPRGYGTNARVLGRYVRERHILTLEEAVRRMTTLPALAFRMKGRGSLREGYAADVTIFDAGKIIDRATFEKPHQYADGIRYVIVNGQIVMENGRLSGKLPGQPIFGPGRR